MIEFKKKPDFNNEYDSVEVTFTMDLDLPYPELLRQFNLFCIAIGHSPLCVHKEEE